MRKSAILVMVLLLASLPILNIVPIPAPNQTPKTTTTTITAQSPGSTDYPISLLTNQNFTGTGSGGTQNWTYEEWGNNPESADGYLHTTDYSSSPASVTLRLQYRSRQCELGWTQPFTYSGTKDVVYAWLTFRWKCSNYYYAGSTNYVNITLEAPIGSGNWIKIYHEHFYSTTGWNYRSVDISDYLRQYGATTYKFEAGAYLTTGGTYYSAPSVIVRYDDVGIAAEYTVKSPTTDLAITINNGAPYANNRLVNLSLSASGAEYMQFKNETGLWTALEPFAITKQVRLSPGDGTKTVYFNATNGISPNPAPVSDTITYDGSAPPAPKLQSPTNGTAINNNAPTFSWSTVTDNGPSGLATYSLDYSTDKTFVTGVTTVSVPSGTTSYTPSSLADGTWYWRVKAIDNAGNAGPYNGTNWFVVIDTVYPPGPTLTSPPTGSFTKVNSVTFTWNPSQDPNPSSGIASYTLQYSKDPSFVTSVTMVSGLTGTSYATPALTDGTWYWRVRAIDRAGNQGSYSGSWSVAVDTAVPGLPTLSSPSTGTNTNVSKPTFTWGAASDPAPSSGITYTLQLDTSTSFNSGSLRTITGLTGTSYTAATALGEGTWYWRVRAVDNAGNTGTYSAYWSIVVDTASPTQPAPSSPIDGAIINVNTPTFTWDAASDATSGVASYTFQIDTSTSFNSGNLRTIVGLSLSYSVPSGSPVSDGNWYWRVKAIDNAGNAGSYSAPTHIIIVDTVNPGAPTLVSPTSGSATNNSKPTFTWGAASDPAPSSGITYTLQLDTSTLFNSGSLRTITGLTGTSYTAATALGEGTWYWRVRAVDNAGNLGSYSGYWSIAVDTVVPGQPTLSSPSSGTNTNVNTPTFTWGAASDPAPSSGITYTLQLDTSSSFNNATGKLRTVTSLTGTSYAVTSPLGDGTWYWRVRAVDRAGNLGSYSGYWSIVIDIVAPNPPTLVSPSNGTQTNVNTPTFTWGAASDPAPSSGIASYTLQYSQDKSFLSGVTTVSGLAGTSYTVTSPLGDGTWYWRVRAVDNAGNPGSYSAYWTIVIDTVIPGAPSLLTPVNGNITKSSTQTFSWTNVSASTYDFYIDKSPAFNNSTGDLKTYLGLSNFSKVVRNLSDGNWYWKVIAQRTGGSNSSTTWGILIDTVAPSQPALTSPSDGTNTNVNTPTFTWGAASDPAPSSGITYTLQMDTNSAFNNASGNLRTISGLAGTSYTIPSGLPLSDRTWRWHVRAVDKAGNQGSYSAGSWTVTVDTVVPGQPTLSSPSSGTNTNVNTPTFTWGAASDPAPSSGITYTLQYSKDQTFTSGVTTVSGLTATNYAVPSGAPLGDGTWYWRVRAVDNAGNPGSYSGYWSIVIDTVNPSAPTLTGPLTGSATNHTTPTFTWGAASDPAPSSGITYTLQLDTSTSFNNATGKLRTITSLGLSYIVPGGAPLGAGTWYWRVRAVDNAGNPGSYSGYWSITVDTVAPGLPTLSSPTDGAQINITRPLLVWNPATDATSGVANYTLQLDTSSSFNSGNLRTISGLTSTSYTVATALGDDTWYWRVRAVDRAGNSGSYSGYWIFTVDTVPPTDLTLSPVGGIYTNSLTITLSITANGAQKIYLSNDGDDWVEYAFASPKSWNLTAGDGVKNVYFKCKDTAGNWAYLSGGFISITLDTVPPTAGLPSVPAYGSITSNNKTTFQWTAGSDSGGSGIGSYSLQFDTTTSFSSANLTAISGLTGTNHTLATALKDGAWYWRINATDKAGNTGSYSTYSILIINTIPPGKVSSLGLLPVNNSLLGLASPQFGWSLVTGANRYHIQIDRYLNFSSSYLIENLTLSNNRFNPSADNNETLTDGTWYWRVEAISLAGAPSGHSFVGAFIIDVTPPSNPQPLSPPQQGATKVTYHTPFLWSLVPDAASYWMQLDATPSFNSTGLYTYTNITRTSCITNVTLDYGFWYWRVVALDAAGNIGDLLAAQIDPFIVDTINPSSPTLRSPQQGYLTNQSTPTLAWYAASDPIFEGVSSGVANYSLWLDTSSSFNSGNLRNIAGLTGTSYNVASPLSDGTWYWFVNATDLAGNTGQGSVALSFTIDIIAPAPPQISSMNPNGASLDESKVTLTWDPSLDPSGIASYMIQLDTSSGFNSPDRLDYLDVGTTTLTTDRELRNGQWYWRVRAIDRAGNPGAWSEPVPFTVDVVGGLSPIMVMMVGGGSGGAIIIAFLGYIMYRRAKIPFVIKKIDQSIKLIGKGEMPLPVPMRTRTQLINGILETKLAILSKEKLEEAKGKKKVTKQAEIGPETLAPQAMPKGAEAPAEAEVAESDVDLVAKELEKLEAKEEKKPSDETELIKREIEELEKGSKKKRKSEGG